MKGNDENTQNNRVTGKGHKGQRLPWSPPRRFRSPQAQATELSECPLGCSSKTGREGTR